MRGIVLTWVVTAFLQRIDREYSVTLAANREHLYIPLSLQPVRVDSLARLD